MSEKATICKEDLKIIEVLREHQVLEDTKGHLLDAKEGTIVVMCSDGDQSVDAFDQHKTLCGCHRHHLVALNGGALLIPSEGLTNKPPHSSEVMLANIETAMQLKQIKTITLYVHAPCGMATLNKLDFLDVIDHLIKAKLMVKGKFAGVQVVCFVHIDYGNRRRTYFVNRSEWELLSITTLRNMIAAAK